jgi:hypothetical protein
VVFNLLCLLQGGFTLFFEWQGGLLFYIIFLGIPSATVAALLWAHLATLQLLLRQQEPLSLCMGRVAWVPVALFLVTLPFFLLITTNFLLGNPGASTRILNELLFLALLDAPAILLYRRRGAPPAYAQVAAQAPASHIPAEAV